MLRFESARPEDRIQLTALLWENGMEYEDPIENFMLAKQGEDIVGCGRIENYPEVAMVRPLVVAQAFRNKGIGRLLLERILPSGKSTVIVARGESVKFYSVNGFTLANWRTIPIHQTNECISCPERTECRPQPMIHRR
jgi:N-acetylglutamate synthase-like GNAT family acetyltransferase